MLKPAFIDISHHNTIPSSLVPARQSGIVGVIHKATEGSNYVDNKLAARFYLARDAGLLWGVYHFIRPGDVEDQVEHFLQSVSTCADERTLFALDWEDNGVSLEDATEFLVRVEDITERSPVLYSGHVLKEALNGEPDERLSRYRLWLAQYASEPTLPPGYDTLWGWQYTDQGEVPGITPPTDLNAYYGTAWQLRFDWAGSEARPPAPTPPQLGEVIVISPLGVIVRVIQQR